MTTNFNQKISVFIRMRTSTKSSKVGSMVLQVTIDSEPFKIPLGISWPVHLFDMESEKLLERFEDDQECYQFNMKLANEKAKANKIAFRYYAIEKSISPAEFKSNFVTFSSKEDVIETFREMGCQLFNDMLVSKGTLKNYVTHFNRIERYFGRKSRWTFNKIQPSDILKLEAWIRDNYSHNTIAGAMRVLKKFFNACHKQGMIINNPMKDYKVPSFSQGLRDVLEPDELKELTAFYFSDSKMTELEKDCLRRYLIGCYTGLRKSDIEQLDPKFHIRNGKILRLSMFKTRKYGKVVEFNLSNTALNLIGSKRGQLFPEMESALLGKTLRRVIARVGIDKYLKFHSSRDTFATIYLELGGNVVDLQEILGHSDLATTMIYVKMTSRTKNNTIAKFDEL